MILVLSQRDIRHPQAGGAEKYMHEALKHLAQNREVVHLSLAAPSLAEEERIDGIRYRRSGKNLLECTWAGFRFYREHKRNIELVIDHVNTHQFLSFLWAKRSRVFFIHQLTQEIWQYFFGKFIGRVLWSVEELLLKCSRGNCITVSESTKRDLESRGFSHVRLVPEGNTPCHLEIPVNPKADYLIHVGRLVPYKRVEDAIRLSVSAGRRLLIVGGGDPAYIRQLKELAAHLGADCEFLGHVDEHTKTELIRNAYLQVVPSIREGWGLVITEAGNLGTPSLVYDVPGTAEAANYGMAGFVARSTDWTSLAEAFNEITEQDYLRVRAKAFEFSLTLSWERTSQLFAAEIEDILLKRELSVERGVIV